MSSFAVDHAHGLHATGTSSAGLARRIALGLSSFSAVTAAVGAYHLVQGRLGDPSMPPPWVLEHTPFTSFLIPGLLLGIVVGGSALVAAVLLWRRAALAPDATLLAGGTLLGWIVCQVALLRELVALQIAFGLLGLALMASGLALALSTPSPRMRWIVRVTAAEAIGFLAPTLIGAWAARAGVGGATKIVLVVLAGAIEGLALGTGQAWAHRVRVDRVRYALLTAGGAAVVWLVAMIGVAAARGEHHAGLIALSVIGGPLALGAIGAAQWLELRRRVDHAAPWILWTALAWTIALPLSFAPAPLVDATTPMAANLALWAAGGVAMAYVMAIVTWFGARRLAAAPATAAGRA